MDSYIPDLETTEVKVAAAFAAYRSDEIRVVERELSGMTHLIASRQGLYAANECECRLVVHGFFFGITLRDNDIFVFEACDLPRGPTRQGRIIRLTRHNDHLQDARVIHKGLDNGCHQIDFVEGRLLVLDTYRQQVVRLSSDFEQSAAFFPLPTKPEGRWRGDDPGYRHVNSLLTVGDRTLLLLHNGAQHTGRKSEIAIFDRSWHELERWELQGSGCHGFALLPGGAVLTCGSMEGNLITAGGWCRPVSPYLTRGLAVGPEQIAVGASRLVERAGRLRNSGTLSFFDRDPVTGLPTHLRSVLEVPGAPTEVRRLDGQDAGLSAYLAQSPLGATVPHRERQA